MRAGGNRRNAKPVFREIPPCNHGSRLLFSTINSCVTIILYIIEKCTIYFFSFWGLTL